MNPRTVFIAAPLFTLSYGVIRILDGLDGSRGPGLAWTTGHLAFLAAMACFVAIFGHLRRMAEHDVFSKVASVIATIGVAALCGQFVIDLVNGFVSADHAAMAVHSASIHDIPGVAPALYDVGPYFFYAGQLALVVRLAVLRKIKLWTPFLVLCDLLFPIIDKDFIPLGAALLLVSFVSISKQVPVTAERAPALI